MLYISHNVFFFNLTTVSDIIFFKLFVYFIHITQLFDVKIFQFYKTAHNNTIKKIVRNENVKFNRFSFLTILQKIQNFVFVKKTFCNVWKRCDINLFNFDVVLKFIKIKIIKTAIAKITRSVTLFFDSNECL